VPFLTPASHSEAWCGLALVARTAFLLAGSPLRLWEPVSQPAALGAPRVPMESEVVLLRLANVKLRRGDVKTGAKSVKGTLTLTETHVIHTTKDGVTVKVRIPG
jgi:hypothetical protein